MCRGCRWEQACLTLTQQSRTKAHCYNMKKNCSKSNYVITGRPICMETLAGQHHRCGVLWVITDLGCGRSRVQILGGTPIFEGVNEIGYKHEVGLGLMKLNGFKLFFGNNYFVFKLINHLYQVLLTNELIMWLIIQFTI